MLLSPIKGRKEERPVFLQQRGMNAGHFPKWNKWSKESQVSMFSFAYGSQRANLKEAENSTVASRAWEGCRKGGVERVVPRHRVPLCQRDDVPSLAQGTAALDNSCCEILGEKLLNVPSTCPTTGHVSDLPWHDLDAIATPHVCLILKCCLHPTHTCNCYVSNSKHS